MFVTKAREGVSERVQLVAADVCGPIELSIEIKCRRCKCRTTLQFSAGDGDPVDYCGQCDEPYEFRLAWLTLFGQPKHEYI